MSAVKTLQACALASLFLLTNLQAATLREALDQAWSVQAPVQNAQNERYSAELQASQAWTPEPPSIELAHTSDQFNNNTGRREWEVGLSTPVWLYGQRERATNVAHSERAAFLGETTLAQLNLAGALRGAWWDARFAELDFTQANRKLAAEQQLAADVSRRVKAGDLAPIDDSQSKIAVLLAKKEVGSAKLVFERNRQAYLLLSRGVALPDLAEVLQANPNPHPLLASLGLNAQSAQAKLSQSAGDTRNAPEIGLTYTSEKDATDEAYRGRIKLGIKIPFGSDSRNRPRIATANAALIASQTALELEQARIANAIASAQMELAQSREAQTLAAEQLKLASEREIKQTLAAEAAQDAAKDSSKSPLQSTAQAATAEQAKPVTETNRAARNDQTVITLKSGEGTEVKMTMQKGAKVNYSWRSEGGLVNVDAHGDPVNPPEGFYHGYGKEKQIANKDGVLEAAFDGKHGWFWRNRSNANVTITLKTSGDYQSIKKMM